MNNMNSFDYNTTRKKLILAEYGRNVQNMVAYICTLPTKEERNRHAQVVIDLMGFLNPHLRDVADFKHKLWDHLHIISDFKIDVDSPYPKPSEEAIHMKPEPGGPMAADKCGTFTIDSLGVRKIIVGGVPDNSSLRDSCWK